MPRAKEHTPSSKDTAHSRRAGSPIQSIGGEPDSSDADAAARQFFASYDRRKHAEPHSVEDLMLYYRGRQLYAQELSERFDLGQVSPAGQAAEGIPPVRSPGKRRITRAPTLRVESVEAFVAAKIRADDVEYSVLLEGQDEEVHAPQRRVFLLPTDDALQLWVPHSHLQVAEQDAPFFAFSREIIRGAMTEIAQLRRQAESKKKTQQLEPAFRTPTPKRSHKPKKKTTTPRPSQPGGTTPSQRSSAAQSYRAAREAAGVLDEVISHQRRKSRQE